MKDEFKKYIATISPHPNGQKLIKMVEDEYGSWCDVDAMRRVVEERDNLLKVQKCLLAQISLGK